MQALILRGWIQQFQGFIRCIANMVPDRTGAMPDYSFGALRHSQWSSPLLPYERALRPSDILNLNNHTRIHVGSTKPAKAASRPTTPTSPIKPACQPNGRVSMPSSYVIPQKRITQLVSLERLRTTSVKHLPGWWSTSFKSNRLKERVVGGLTKEDELRVIWAGFDDRQRMQTLTSVADDGDVLLSGNDVLGAWEEDLMLRDLDREEGSW